ncbi:MAG: HAD-IA family hydrolase [Rhodoglobus sp.]
MIRAAVFDLGGVLEVVDDDRWQQRWMTRWELRSGTKAGTLGRVLADAPTLSERGFADLVTSSLGLRPDESNRVMLEFWDAYCGDLDVAMRDFVADLGESMTVAALSNSADGARREDERRYGFDALFDLMVYSHEVGIAKPDAAIYLHTQKALGVDPHEIVFVDDRETAVEGARAVGWHAVLHSSTEPSIAEIRAIIERESIAP